MCEMYQTNAAMTLEAIGKRLGSSEVSSSRRNCQDVADAKFLLTRAESAEAELARVKAGGIESMRRAEDAEKDRDKADATWILALKEIAALKTERDQFAERSKMVEAENKRLREALKQYAEKMNWGYYDQSGCARGHGDHDDACFIGPDIARKALNGGINE